VVGSKKRYNEAVTIFQQDIPKVWIRKRKMKEIAERFHLILLN
jgi:hypothetical protein